MSTNLRDEISAELLERLRFESFRAHQKHAAQGMSLFDPACALDARLAALGEEFGEVCRALTADGWEGEQQLFKELIQLGNVAMTWAQCVLDHGTDHT